MAEEAEGEEYNTEFRSYVDDAWYSVRALVEGKGERGDGDVSLRVKYHNFPDDEDTVFAAGGFKSLNDLQDFAGRFRRVSAQLQDSQCSGVVKCMRVCASDNLGPLDCRFYDAVVEDVVRIAHSYNHGEEECECNFLLSWLHGPNVGNISSKRVANICLLQKFELDPAIESFVEIALRKLEKASGKSDLGAGNDVASNPVGAIVKQEPIVSGSLREGTYAHWFWTKVRASEGGAKVHCDDRQDTDIGGDKRKYMILLQNLEKGLASSTVSEFILQQTSIAPQAYIFPSLQWETYTNGVIAVDCQKDLEDLFDFLQNPEHIVVSSKGRPWVATEKTSMNVSNHWNSKRESPEKSVNRIASGFSTELKVVCAGTEEYKRATKRKAVFLQFIDHQKRQHKRLSMEEESIS